MRSSFTEQMAGKNLLSITINYLNLNKLGNLGCIKKQHLIPLTERERREGVDYS